MVCIICSLDNRNEAAIGACIECGTSLCGTHLDDAGQNVMLYNYCVHALLAM